MFTSASSKLMMTDMAASSLLKLFSSETTMSKSIWDGSPKTVGSNASSSRATSIFFLKPYAVDTCAFGRHAVCVRRCSRVRLGLWWAACCLLSAGCLKQIIKKYPRHSIRILTGCYEQLGFQRCDIGVSTCWEKIKVMVKTKSITIYYFWNIHNCNMKL